MPSTEVRRAAALAVGEPSRVTDRWLRPPRLRPTLRRWLSRVAWALVLGLLVAQWGLFRQFLKREVLWSYPPNHDQLAYLQESYAACPRVLDISAFNGFGPKLIRQYPRQIALAPGVRVVPQRLQDNTTLAPHRSPVGFMLPIQAAALYFFTGPSRRTALSLNFIYFALFQIALVATLQWLTGRWSVALIGLGLLLSASAPFFWAGGIYDFRMDFIAMCLFGTLMCLFIRSGAFAHRGWSIAAGLCAALLFSFRFLTLIYLGGVMAVVLGFLGARVLLRRGRSDNAELRRAQLCNALLACAIVAAVAVPVVVQRWWWIEQYYVVGHVRGAESQVRAAEQGAGERWSLSALMFYPASIYQNHAGTHFLRRGALLVGLGITLGVLNLLVGRRRRSRLPIDFALAWVTAAACLLVPLTVLTWDPAKSPVVGNIMIGPLVWLAMLALVSLARAYRRTAMLPVAQVVLAAVAAGMLYYGMGHQSSEYGRRRLGGLHRPEIKRLLAMYDRCADAAETMRWSNPNFCMTHISDAFNSSVFKVMEFERRGQLFDGEEVLSESVSRVPPEWPMSRLSYADFFVLIDKPMPGPDQYEYPFDQQMRELQPLIERWCHQNAVELGRYEFGPPFDCSATLLIRPAVRVEGQPDGWVTKNGTKVIALAQVLRQRPNILLRGKNAASFLNGVVPQPKAQTLEHGKLVELSARMTNNHDEYRLEIDLDPRQLPDHGIVSIDLSFDASFVPRRLNGSPDDRELVMRLPDDGSLQPAYPLTKEASAGR